MKALFFAAVAVGVIASPAIADMAPSTGGTTCSSCPDLLRFGSDRYGREVVLERKTLKRVSDFSIEFSYRAGSERYDSQARCVGSRLRVFDIASRKWIELESPAMFRLIGTACEMGGF